jgi:branched-subunit amino acid transport protein AzlD
MTIAKVFIILTLIAIIFSLFRGLYYLVKEQGQTKKTVNSLTWRISLSVFLIILLILAIKFGIIVPHGVQA